MFSSPQFRTRLLMLGGVALAAAVMIGASKLFHVPAHPQFGGSILHEPAPIVSFLIVGVALMACVLLCTLVAGSVRFDAGLFCAAVGGIALSVRSGTVGDVLRAQAPHAGGPTMFIVFAAELVLLYAVLGLGWAVLWVLHRKDYLKADQFRDGVEDAEDWTGAKLCALALQAGGMAILMLLLLQTDTKTQVIWAVGISSYLGALLAYFLLPVSPSPWLWTGPLAVGLVGYVLAYLNTDANDLAWRTGHLRFTLGALSRALPIDYASAGTAGAVMGYWMSRRWYRQRMIEAGEVSAGASAGGSAKEAEMERFFGNAP